MFEWRCLPKREKDSIIREYMRQDEEKDFKEYARKKYNIFFTENDIELYLYEFEEKPQEETKVKEKVKRKKLSEMTDIELKEYYREKEEEKERERRILHEINEEENEKIRIRGQIEAREWLKARGFPVTEEEKRELERKNAKNGLIWIVGLLIIYIIIMIWLNGPNQAIEETIGETLIAFLISGGVIIFAVIAELTKRE